MDALTFFIADDRHVVDHLILVVGVDADQARQLAVQDLRENPHHTAVEVCCGDAVLFKIQRRCDGGPM